MTTPFVAIALLTAQTGAEGTPWLTLLNLGFGGLLVILLLTKRFGLYREIEVANQRAEEWRQEAIAARSAEAQARADLIKVQASVITDVVEKATLMTQTTARAADILTKILQRPFEP